MEEEHIKETTWLLQGMEGPNFLAVVKELTEAEALMTQRIQLIKIVDRSDHGWATIVEYETNKLGLDSDDTKQLTRAEKEAQ